MRMAQLTACLPYFYNALSIYISFLVLYARMLLANRPDEDPEPLTKPTNLPFSYASKFCTLFFAW